MRSAMRQVRSFLKAQGVNTKGVKQGNVIRLFAARAGLSEPSGSLKAWLLELWAGQQNEHIGKVETSFYLRPEWRELRAAVIAKYGPACMRCASTNRPTVDHVKPRSLFPALEMEIGNLQVLCRRCNSSKSNGRPVDYRNANAA